MYISQTIVHVYGQVPPSFTWHIPQTILDYLILVITVCIQNKSKLSHWFCKYALNFAITMSSKNILKIKIALTIDQVVDEEFGVVIDCCLLLTLRRRYVMCLTLFFHL
jgi:hypothetical protein